MVAGTKELTKISADAVDLTKINNGTFTVKSLSTGEHRTFKVQKAKNGEVRFVKLLIGPDNENDFIPFALLNDRGLFTFKKYRGSQWDKLSRFLCRLSEFESDGKIEIFHSGRCVRCGRKLTTPESVETGIGPVCAGR
jgi:hypothetical protein